MPHSSYPITVFLVDDSAVIRGALRKVFESDTDIEIIGHASNGERAVELVQEKKPDIVILDIEMPVMDGLTALPKIQTVSPGTKVIMFSSLTENGASVTLKALSLGAVECVVKPNASEDVGEGSPFQAKLIKLIKALAAPSKSAREPQDKAPSSTPALQTAPAPKAPAVLSLRNPDSVYHGKPSILAIGSSTGGPQALFNVMKHFKGFDIPIVITQHMPATFTKILAQHIEQQTGVPCHEGEEGMEIIPGHAYVAPGGFHMKLEKSGVRTVIRLDNGPPVNFCKPAVDPMMLSAIEAYGKRVLGVILTGMGNDGIGSGQKLNEIGAPLIAQDEASSVVWGMPGAVAKAGHCSQILPLDEIGPAIRRIVMEGR